jgi:hypothetical protein
MCVVGLSASRGGFRLGHIVTLPARPEHAVDPPAPQRQRPVRFGGEDRFKTQREYLADS